MLVVVATVIHKHGGSDVDYETNDNESLYYDEVAPFQSVCLQFGLTVFKAIICSSLCRILFMRVYPEVHGLVSRMS